MPAPDGEADEQAAGDAEPDLLAQAAVDDGVLGGPGQGSG